MKILLITGGWSSERKVALKGAVNVGNTLQSLGHTVSVLDLRDNFDNLIEAARQNDFAFINLHGAPGEDGLVQAVLERVGCPYQGSGPAGSFLALNKVTAKQIFRQSGLPTVAWEFLPVPPAPDWQPRLPYPLFVKSNTGGSSLHLGRACDRSQLDTLLTKIFAERQEVLLEPELKGKEVTCAVLGDEALPPLLIEPLTGDFFDYTSKYTQDGALEICPAPIGKDATARLQTLALAAHKALGLYGYSRADFIMDDTGNFTLLEVNTLPGMTDISLFPQQAAAAGLDFGQLLERLIKLGLCRFPHKKKP